MIPFLAFIQTVSAGRLYGMGPLANSSISGQSDFRFRYRMPLLPLADYFQESHPRLHDYLEQVERLNVLLSKPKSGLTLGLQLDQVALFLNEYRLDGELMRSIDLYDNSLFSPHPDFLIVPEKVFLIKKWDKLEMGLGDIYASFGRGIALNIVKNTALDLDTSILGAKFVLSEDDFELTALTGLTNNQQVNINTPNIRRSDGIGHMITGAQFIRYGLNDGTMSVGAHGVITKFGRQSDADLPDLIRYEQGIDASVAGLSTEIQTESFGDWYFEGDVFYYHAEEMRGADNKAFGTTFYASGSVYPEFGSILFEGKHSLNSERINTYSGSEFWEVATPPSLEYERVITEDSSAAVNSNDIYGGKVKVDVPLLSQRFTPYASLSVFRDNDVGGLHFNSVPETIFHPITGFEFLPKDQVVLLNTGFRTDIRDQNDGMDMLFHIDGEYSTHLFGQEHLEINISGWKFWWGDDTHNDFLEMRNALVWKHGKKLDFTIYQDWSNNSQITSVGNLTEQLYGAFEIKYKPNDKAEFKALVGSYMAGIRCSGGQCRQMPGFDGAEIVYKKKF